jgi:hypothetical protein
MPFMSVPQGPSRPEPAAEPSPEPSLLKLRGDALDWREVEGQVVVLDRAGSVYLAVNGSGTVLWPAIVEGATRSQLVQLLMHNFDIEATRAERDVDAFVASLAERGLLES